MVCLERIEMKNALLYYEPHLTALKHNSYDVVAISTHPDDVEIGIGALLTKLSREFHYKVCIIDLTNGEPTPHNDDPKTRIEEAQKAAQQLDVDRVILSMPNRELMDNLSARYSLAVWLRTLRPQLVFSPYGRTSLASPDHYQAQLITEAAIFYSKLTRWEYKFKNTAPHRINKLLYYYTGREHITLTNEHYFAVDVSKYYIHKIKALKEYKSQFKSSQNVYSIIKWIKGLNSFWGSQIGVEYAEICISPTILVFDDPLNAIPKYPL